MNILAFNTASTSGSVAISRGSSVLFASYLDVRITHSQRLLPRIDSGLKQCALTMDDIDLICVANGPGSFTGVRIGLATAKGFCLGKEIPLLAVNNLELLAWNVSGSARAVLPLIDARMGEIYGALFSADGQELLASCNSKPSAFFDKIDVPVLAVGSGALLYESLLQDAGIDYQLARPHQHLQMATTLISMALSRENVPRYNFEAISSLEPCYLRKSQAEIMREQNLKKRGTHE